MTCPKCKSPKVLKILYGEYPIEFTTEGEEKEDTTWLGGCVITPESPKWHCDACEHEWGTV